MFLLRHGQSFFNLHFNRTRTGSGDRRPGIDTVRHRTGACRGGRSGRDAAHPDHRLALHPRAADRAAVLAHARCDRDHYARGARARRIHLRRGQRTRASGGEIPASRLRPSAAPMVASAGSSPWSRRSRVPMSSARRWRRARTVRPPCSSVTGHSFWRSPGAPSKTARSCNTIRPARAPLRDRLGLVIALEPAAIRGIAAAAPRPVRARRARRREPRLHQRRASTGLCAHRGYARRHRALYLAAASRGVRALRILASPRGRGRLGHGRDPRELTVADRRALERALRRRWWGRSRS